MSLPSFPSHGDGSTYHPSPPSQPVMQLARPRLGGAGLLLPKPLLIVCGVCTLIATAVSIFSITLQLKGYRRPNLQRFVVRIMIMVPLYAIASLIALFSLDAAFFIDAVRDLYEAFVIYAFLQLLITYLGGERSLLILLHGRQPIPHPFPVNLFLAPMDISDPWVLLKLKRGVLQYVQIKPLLVLVTIILKATDTYREGALAWDSGYTYVSVIYNTSICLSLYCLAMFWVCVSSDLKPFRPVPKFLCVKGILFFSFWQSIGISILVAFGAIKKLGAYTDAEHMSLALTDALVCLEMPIFAVAHQYAFQASDYIDNNIQYAARMPFYYALRDAFGLKDVWEDFKATFKGRGISYQAYEPAEGGLHYGQGRQRRIRAGLRYSKGGKQKYWITTPGDEARQRGETGVLTSIKRRVDERRAYREGYAPLLPNQAERVVHLDPDADWSGFSSDSDDSDAPSLDFKDLGNDPWEDQTYSRARKIEYVGYPNVDVSKEEAKRALREDEEGVLQGKWRQGKGLTEEQRKRRERAEQRGKKQGGKFGVYGAWANRVASATGLPQPDPVASSSNSSPPDNKTRSRSRSRNGQPTEIEGDADDLANVVLRHPGEEEATEAWLYDGDNERDSDWINGDVKKGKMANGDAQQLRWTSKGKQQRQSNSAVQSPEPQQEDAAKSAFALGEDDEDDQPDIHSDPSIDSPVRAASPHSPLPSDAVDLLIEDTEALREINHEQMRRGEPATHMPKHVYRHGEQSEEHEHGDPHGHEDKDKVDMIDEDGNIMHPQEEAEKAKAEGQAAGSAPKDDKGPRRPSVTGTRSKDGKTQMRDMPEMHRRIFGNMFDADAEESNPWG